MSLQFEQHEQDAVAAVATYAAYGAEHLVHLPYHRLDGGSGDPSHELVEVVEAHERSIGIGATCSVTRARMTSTRAGAAQVAVGWSIEFVDRRRSNILDHWSQRPHPHQPAHRGPR